MGNVANRPALKETCRAAGGRVPLWPWHRARLANGGVPEAVLDLAEARVLAEAAEWAQAPTKRARLTLVVAPDDTVSVDCAQRLSSLDVVGGPTVARVDVAELPPIPERPAKPADRSWWDAAHARAASLGADQALLVDARGTILDGSTAALLIAENGVLITPPQPPAIPSVAVAFLRARGAEAGLDVRFEPVSWERYVAADEAMLANAFGGVVAVRDRGGELTARAAALFAEVWA
jgi:branched-subunit amino acid aminotransferase/4-amino-4-deoxychorismate lyase